MGCSVKKSPSNPASSARVAYCFTKARENSASSVPSCITPSAYFMTVNVPEGTAAQGFVAVERAKKLRAIDPRHSASAVVGQASVWVVEKDF
jgi:hypothetical protein